MITQTQENVVYAARTTLLDLAFETASTRNLRKVSKQVVQGAKIFLWLQALDYSEYLSFTEREKIWKCLVSIADLNEIPLAPVLGNRGVTINYGGGNSVTNNYTYEDYTPFTNPDVDTPQEVVDSFPVTSANGAVWWYVVQSGTNLRQGKVTVGWLSDGSQITDIDDESTTDIGDTSDVEFDVDFSGGNIRLLAVVASNNWSISGKRLLINE